MVGHVTVGSRCGWSCDSEANSVIDHIYDSRIECRFCDKNIPYSGKFSLVHFRQYHLQKKFLWF